MKTEILGPFLTLDAADSDRMHLAAVFVAPQGVTVPAVQVQDVDYPAVRLAQIDESVIYRVRFAVPTDRASAYAWQGTTYDLASDLRGDLRIAFASCNGEEHGDMDREEAERNVMWARLGAQHEAAPFSILLHGGDQIYADEATLGHDLSHHWPKEVPKDPSRADLEDLRQHLRQGFLARYTALMAAPSYAWLCARVPSLAQWDDHDICDGWGSLPRSRTYSPVGQVLFEVAREMALLFQHGCRDGDLPARFHDPEGAHLGWVVAVPGLALVAPDLRSERTRRQIMGPGGWRMMEQIAAQPQPDRLLLLSSVPLLGPRLSLLETLMVLTPRMQKYEDDLRDQWQSRAHRAEWQRMLQLVCTVMQDGRCDVTALSGEIHLATRATMATGRGRALHQLVASGVTHRPPPQKWARFLGALAAFGDSPLPGHPIRIHRIPGQRQRYIAERNALLVTRQSDRWRAEWSMEQSGLTPALPI
ncbi:alkaline phosphatase D family protein [Roseobacter weihaiensis]|uniref:alkaline phosphatase D family protein n=1 Tax=Roseobacter weihaiensis TaxID=2763262 RepID=UPI001D0AD843|nr:alkaline phosphatase D family protein [Roseobacter sp. H9]